MAPLTWKLRSYPALCFCVIYRAYRPLAMALISADKGPFLWLGFFCPVASASQRGLWLWPWPFFFFFFWQFPEAVRVQIFSVLCGIFLGDLSDGLFIGESSIACESDHWPDCWVLNLGSNTLTGSLTWIKLCHFELQFPHLWNGENLLVLP